MRDRVLASSDKKKKKKKAQCPCFPASSHIIWWWQNTRLHQFSQQLQTEEKKKKWSPFIRTYLQQQTGTLVRLSYLAQSQFLEASLLEQIWKREHSSISPAAGDFTNFSSWWWWWISCSIKLQFLRESVPWKQKLGSVLEIKIKYKQVKCCWHD